MFGWKTIQFWESGKDKMLSKTAQEEQHQDTILAFKWPSSCWTNKLLQKNYIKVFYGQLRETGTPILKLLNIAILQTTCTKHCLRLLGPLYSKIFYLKTKLVQWIIKIILPLHTDKEKIDAVSIDWWIDGRQVRLNCRRPSLHTKLKKCRVPGITVLCKKWKLPFYAKTRVGRGHDKSHLNTLFFPKINTLLEFILTGNVEMSNESYTA